VSILLLMLLVAPVALLSGSLADGIEIAIRYLKPLMEDGLPPKRPPGWRNADRRARCRVTGTNSSPAARR
jgi:hypothetical protein